MLVISDISLAEDRQGLARRFRAKYPRSLYLSGVGLDVSLQFLDPLIGRLLDQDPRLLENSTFCSRWHFSVPGFAALDGVGFAWLESFYASRGGVAVSTMPSEGARLLPRTTHPNVRNGIWHRDKIDLGQFRCSRLEKLVRPGLDQLVARALLAQYRAAELLPWPSYVGPNFPKLLVLGPSFAGERLAFDPRVRGTRKLLCALPQGVWGEVGFAQQTSDLANLWRTLDRPGVLAVGKPALDDCRAAGVPCVPVYNPRARKSTASDYTSHIESATTLALRQRQTWLNRAPSPFGAHLAQVAR